MAEERTQRPEKTSHSSQVAHCPRQYGGPRRVYSESGPSLRHLPAGRHQAGVLTGLQRDWLQAQEPPRGPGSGRGGPGPHTGGSGVLSSASAGQGRESGGSSEPPEPHPTERQSPESSHKAELCPHRHSGAFTCSGHSGALWDPASYNFA